QKIWFWNLKRGTERGIYEKDYSESAIKYFEVDSGYMIVTGLPANWAGQLVIAVLNTGKHIVFKVTGTITYPFDFESIFTKPTTTTTATTTTITTAAPTTTTTDVPKTTSSIATTTTTTTRTTTTTTAPLITT
uniref:Uncharacterized protein n=1 Tax=Clytia hemisphaerica TaxID=252671 RepID=A0A7M5XMM3_9CNID